MGNGLDLRNNLYWGAKYGFKNHFKKYTNWKLILSEKNTSNTIGGGTWIPIGASGGPTTEGGPGDPDDPNNPNQPKDPKNGDIYVDESTGDLYTYINNQWTNKTTTGNITADTDATIIVTDGTAAALKNVKLKVDASKLKDIPAASIKHGANGQVLTTDSTGKTVWAAADEADIRKVGANNHISSDAGVGGNGTSVGTGANNFAVGSSTLASNTGGGNNIALGTSALASNTEGGNNIALGFQALPANKTGNANIALGANALVLNSEGSGNIAIGILAGRNNTTGSSNIILGQQSEVEDPAGDNQLSIGNLIFGTGLDGHKFPSRLSTGDIGIGIKVPTQKLDVDGGVRIRTLNPGVATDKIVVADATGVLKKLSDLPPASIGSGTEGASAHNGQHRKNRLERWSRGYNTKRKKYNSRCRCYNYCNQWNSCCFERCYTKSEHYESQKYSSSGY